MAQSLSAAAEHNRLSNSSARADLIREAVQQQAQLEAQVDAVNAEIREFKSRVIKGDLGFKLSDWNAMYRVSQLEIADRDTLLETIREGFAALHIGGVMDWVAAAETAARRGANGHAEPDEAARTAGHHDGLGGGMDHAARYPQGEPGHADYMLGLADGEAERARVMALGDHAERYSDGLTVLAVTAPKRGRGRPRKRQPEAGAEF
jgi:hypothetical protein